MHTPFFRNLFNAAAGRAGEIPGGRRKILTQATHPPTTPGDKTSRAPGAVFLIKLLAGLTLLAGLCAGSGALGSGSFPGAGQAKSAGRASRLAAPHAPTDTVILACSGTGTGGDAADSRGVVFTVSQPFRYVALRFAGATAGTYSLTAELRRSGGFTGSAEASATVTDPNIPGLTGGTPYHTVWFDLGNVSVSAATAFSLRFVNVSGPGSLYFETFGSSKPCANVMETNENNVASPTERGDPAGFQVLAPQGVIAITQRPYDQTRPAVAYNSLANEYLVAWEDLRYGTGPTDLFGRRVAADGTPLGDDLPLVAINASESVPDLAYNSSANEYLLVWQDDRGLNDQDVLAERISASGSPLGSIFFLMSTSNFRANPKVAYNAATNQYLVTWEERQGSDEFHYFNIFARKVNPDGTLDGGPIAITNGTLDNLLPAVASGGGGYLLAWEAKQPFNAGMDIHARLLGGDGALQGGEITLSNSAYDQLNPRLAYSPQTGQYLAVWEDHSINSGTKWDIYGQRVGTDGSLPGGNFPIASISNGHHLNPDVAYNFAAHEFVVAWEYEYSPSDHDVYRRRVAADGSLPEGELPVTTSGAYESLPRLASGGRDALVVWQDNRDVAAEGLNIYGDLARLYPLSGKVYAGAVGVQTAPLYGVTVSLYCSSDASLGNLVEGASTDGTGYYELSVAGDCAYYNLVETDLPAYTSAGASSTGGVKINDNQLQYTPLLLGKTLGSNNFWDFPPSAVAHCSSCSECSTKLDGTYGLVLLDQDLSAPPASCISFQANNATLDCQGHTLSGDGETEFSYGIRMVAQQRNTVKNCTVQNFENGIALYNSNYNTLSGNHLLNNLTAGIYLEKSENNTLNGNELRYNSYGLTLNASDANALANNTACKQSLQDIYAPNATSGNSLSTSDTCDSIYNWNGSGGISYCTQNCTPKVAVQCATGPDCLAALNGSSYYVTLTGNALIPDGLRVTGNHLTLDCSGHTLSGGGSGAGISLDNRVDVTVKGCTIRNYNHGIELRSASKNLLQGNTLTGNNVGVALMQSTLAPQDNNLLNNAATDNALYGVSLVNALNTTLTNNNLSYNGLFGLWVSGECNQTLSGNTAGSGGALQFWHDLPIAGALPVGNYGEAVLCNVHHAILANLTMDNLDAKNDGILAVNSSASNINDNHLNRTNGITAVNSPFLNLYNNTLTASRGNAVDLTTSPKAQVYSNHLSGNGGAGVSAAVASDNTRVYTNTIESNYRGIQIDGSDAITVTDNAIRKNSAEGVVITDTGGIQLSNNVIRNNGMGVYLHTSAGGTSLQNNLMCYNSSSDLYNAGAGNSGSGNTCARSYGWNDAGAGSGGGCSQKCIGWYQYNYGYSFHNPTKDTLSFGCPWGTCQGDYVDTFGENQVYLSADICIGLPLCLPFLGCYCVGYEKKISTGVPDPHALVYYTAAYFHAARPGECTGMSTTSLRFQHGDKFVSSYDPNAHKVSDLQDNLKIRNAIDPAHGAIVSAEFIQPYLTQWTFFKMGGKNANGVLDQVKQSLQSNNLGSLVIHSLTDAHNIVATDVRESGNTARIYIYDSNREEFSTKYPDSEDQYPYISIDKSANTWSYSAHPGFYAIWFLPYATANGKFTIPLSMNQGLFQSWGSATSEVSDANGKEIGTVNGQLVTDIPGAAPMPDWGAGNAADHPAFYILPRGGYTATLSGQATGAYSTSVFLANSLILLDGVPSTSATRDTFSFGYSNDGPPAPGLSLRTSDMQKTFSVMLAEKFPRSGTTRTYRLRQAGIVQGGQALVRLSPDFNSLIFMNRGPVESSYTVEFQNSMVASSAGISSSLPTAQFAGLRLPPMSTAVLAPHDWLHLGATTLDLQVQACGDNVCSSGEEAASCPQDCRPAACVTPVAGLQVSTSTALCPGDYSLPDAGGAGALQITADNLTLDCQGARLRGSGTGAGLAGNGHSHVTVKGCTLQGYATGMDFANAAQPRIESSALISNTVTGLRLSGSQAPQVVQNALLGNATGLDLSASSGASAVQNLACGSGSFDINAQGAAGATGSGNRCDLASAWKDAGQPVCTYTCVLGSAPANRVLYLPLAQRK